MAVYLIHFKNKYHHARHYLGWTDDLEQRMEAHRSGNGSRLMEVICQARIEWEVARIWQDGDRALERRLKRWHKARDLCPICRAERKGKQDGSIE